MVYLTLFKASSPGNANEEAAESAENEAGNSETSGSGTSTYGAGPTGTGTAGISGAGPAGAGPAGAGPAGAGPAGAGPAGAGPAGAGPAGTDPAGAGPSGTGTVSDESQSLIAPSFKAQKCTLWWKAWWLNLAILFLNAGEMSLTAVQSSLHSDASFGVTSMAVGAAASLLGAFVTAAVLKVVGNNKKTLIWGMVFSMMGPINNFYPRWFFMIISSIIAGFAYSVVLTTTEVYTAEFAHWHVGLSEQESRSGHGDRQPESGPQSLESRSDDVQGSSEMEHPVERRHSDEIENSGENIDSVSESLIDSKLSPIMNRFCMFHCAMTKFGYFIGNVGASVILTYNSSANQTNSTSPAHNGSQPHGDTGYCGAAYCNEDLNWDFNKVPTVEQNLVYVFLGFSLGLCVLGTLVAIFGLDNVNRAQVGPAPETESNGNWSSVLATLKETLCMPFKNLQMGLLMIVFVSIAANDSFWMSDFPKGYIACYLGMPYIGYVMQWMGIAGPIAAILTGLVSNPWPRRGCILGARFLHIGLAISLIFYQMKKDSNLIYILFAYTGAWNFGSGIVIPLTAALAGCLFKNSLPTAMSTLRAWGTLAAVLIFAWNNYLCMDIKLYVIVSVMVASIIAYVILEFKVERPQRSSE